MISDPQPCNFCGGTILWLQTNRGAWMPVDAEPAPSGNVLRTGGRGGVLGKNQAAAARASGAQLHLHHAVTCEHASKWQRPKGGRR